MQIQYIERVENQIVGDEYMVPCVKLLVTPENDPSRRGCIYRPGTPHTFEAGDWVPITGPLHTDPDLGNPNQHFHYDFRFTRPDLFWGEIISLNYVDQLGGRGLAIDPDVWHQRLTMIRPPLAKPEFDRDHREWWSGMLEKKFKDDAIQVGSDGIRRCPHQGIPITSGTKLPCGSTRCAGHNLVWNPDGTQKQVFPHPLLKEPRAKSITPFVPDDEVLDKLALGQIQSIPARQVASYKRGEKAIQDAEAAIEEAKKLTAHFATT
jgi:hypothetical protein